MPSEGQQDARVNLGTMPRIHVRVEGETGFHKAVLCVCGMISVCLYTQYMQQNYLIRPLFSNGKTDEDKFHFCFTEEENVGDVGSRQRMMCPVMDNENGEALHIQVYLFLGKLQH